MRAGTHLRRDRLALLPVGAALLLHALLPACDVEEGCRADEECPAGHACVVGECRPLIGSDLSGVVPDDGGSPPDLTDVIPDGWSSDQLVGTCSTNMDGVIDDTETPLVPGLGGIFVTNPGGTTVAVQLKPTGGVWDYTAAPPGERKVFDQLRSPAGTWWAAEFPTATHAQRLDDNQPFWGVYRASSTALELLGVASETGGLQKTLLKYDTPIKVLTFPLAQDSQWTSESDVSGTAQGVFFAAREKYTFSVDARGTTKVPLGQFDTLRLRIDYRQSYGLYVTTRITYLHLAECWGAVARIRSKDNESSADFTEAAEYRRLGAP